MTDLSIIIPARNEEFLQRTIDDVLLNIRGDTEIIAVLDGYWPNPGIEDNPRLKIIHNGQSIGQRAATNQGVKLSTSKYIMKLDAHCSVSEGFDLELMSEIEYDWTVIPRMYTLHVFSWVCKNCGHAYYQGPVKKDPCKKCSHEEYTREIVWKRNRSTDYMWIDRDLRVRYFDGNAFKAYNNDLSAMKKKYSPKFQTRFQGEVTDVMNGVGACWMLHRERYWDLGGMDEQHGSWGQMGVEVAMKAWLSGGRHVVNKRAWFAHLFRTQGGDFSFPYKNPGEAQEKARSYSKGLWLGNNWHGQTRRLGWLIDRFKPLPGWDDYNDSDVALPIQKVEHKIIKECSCKDKDKSDCDKCGIVVPEPFASEIIKFAEEKKVIESEFIYDMPEEVIANPTPNPIKGMVYYTNNQCEERIMNVARNYIRLAANGHHVVSVSHYPIDFGDNIVMRLESGVLSMFKQILVGLKAVKADIVFLVEHDVIYHRSHFDFVPEREDVYYYNENTWKVCSKTGQAVFYHTKQTSGLCAWRELLIEHYTKRVERVQREGFTRRMGFEPGTHSPPNGIDKYKAQAWMSEYPNVDIRHKSNLTSNRFDPKQFRSKRSIKGWTLADEVPGWGKTKDRFDSFIYDLAGG